MTPPVSILLPVRNEEKWINRRLQSIVEQEYRDFELVISDNASTDKTAAICQELCEADDRITLIRQERNIGSTSNFKSVLDHASGDYVVFAGGHDEWSPNYVHVLKKKLDENEEVVLSFARTVYVDGEGQPLDKKTGVYATEGVGNPVRRFNVYMWADQNPFYGLMRREQARSCWVNEPCVASGQIFLQRMAILGQFAYEHEALFFRRQNREPESRKERLVRYRNTLFEKPTDIRLSFWRSAFMVIRSAWRSPLEGSRRRRRRLRFLLVLSSFGVFARFWSYLWRNA